MKEKIIKLIKKANELHNGELIEVDINQYVDKITENAKIISISQNNDLCAFIAYYDNNPTREMAYLTMIVVDDKSQGVGYGKNLINTVSNILKAQGFKNFKLEVKNKNINAINLYKYLGFVISEVNESSSYMIKKLC